MADIVRIVRVLEYIGERSSVERVLLQNAVKGQRDFGCVMIREAIVGTFPEVLLDNYIEISGKDACAQDS